MGVESTSLGRLMLHIFASYSAYSGPEQTIEDLKAKD